MKQLNKDGAGEWSTPLPPREKSPERETTPEQIRADAECVFAAAPHRHPRTPLHAEVTLTLTLTRTRTPTRTPTRTRTLTLTLTPTLTLQQSIARGHWARAKVSTMGSPGMSIEL